MQQHALTIAITCKLLGVKHLVLSPGSRSAPLVMAFNAVGGFDIHIAIDERSAAYQALGMAQQMRVPVMLLCTSGTAAANYYPAVAEAYYQRIPLLVFTADRPEAFLHQQDGQMIDQKHLFGQHVRHFVQIPEYAHGKEQHKQVVALMAEAISKTNHRYKGPVHINVPFTEPLYQLPEFKSTIHTLTKQVNQWLYKHVHDAKPQQIPEELLYAWLNSERKLILIGQEWAHADWVEPLTKLANCDDVVVLSDVVSNAHPFCTAQGFDYLLQTANENSLQQLQPDFIISLGGQFVSKKLKLWLRQTQPQYHFRIQSEDEKVNTYQNVTHFIECSATQVFTALSEIEWYHQTSNTYKQNWQTHAQKGLAKFHTQVLQSGWNELHAMYAVLQQLPDVCNVQLANSSVVRYASYLGTLHNSWLVNANRGTSGIDGSTSTAVGAAKVNLRPTVLITGDLSFGYDINALWQQHLPNNLRIIVFNNNGGGIFKLIDGPDSFKPAQPYFTTPMKVNVKGLATSFGLRYYQANDLKKLNAILNQFLDPMNTCAVLELNFDMDANAKAFKKLMKKTSK